MSSKKGSTEEEEKSKRTRNLTQEVDFTFEEFEEKIKAWRNSTQEKDESDETTCPSEIMKEFRAIRNATQARMSKMDTCAYCGANDGRYKKCTGCKAVSYCSRNCQKNDWKSRHKKSCLSVKRKQSKGPPPKITNDLNLIEAMNMHMDDADFVEKCVEKFKAGNQLDAVLIDALVTLLSPIEIENHLARNGGFVYALE